MSNETVRGSPIENGSKPSRLWYLLSLFLFLVFGTGGIVFIVVSLFTMLQDGVRFVVPGELVLNVEQTGKYTLYNETSAFFEGRMYPGSAELPETIEIRITGLSNEINLPLDPATAGRETFGSTVKYTIGTILFDEPGTYLIQVLGDFPARVFSIRRSICGQLVVSFVIFLAAGLVGWVGAPVLAIIVFARRSAAKKALPSPVAVPQREDVEAPPGKVKDDNTTWAVFCHLGAFAGYFFPLANIIVPLVLWLTKKDESELVDDHGRESVNFQISMLIYMIAAALLTCLLIGIVLLSGSYCLEYWRSLM